MALLSDGRCCGHPGIFDLISFIRSTTVSIVVLDGIIGDTDPREILVGI
jgi:hypothetical protein